MKNRTPKRRVKIKGDVFGKDAQFKRLKRQQGAKKESWV